MDRHGGEHRLALDAGLSSQEQKEEFIRLLDVFEKCRLNTVIVQVRPSSDAFYPSSFEPWSHYLTGTRGKAPSLSTIRWIS